jgi:hypothetical protein
MPSLKRSLSWRTPQVSSFGDAKKQSNRRPRRPTAEDAARGSRQPQPSATAATASTGSTTAVPAGSRPETTSQPSPKPTEGSAASGRTWRAPSRRQRHSLHQPDCSCSCSSSGLWTAATTLGVIVLLGRVIAVVFLCSCLYGARFVRAWAAGDAGASAKAQLSGEGGVVGVGSSSRCFSDPVAVAGDEVAAEMCTTEERKKKVVMAGLLDRAGKAPSSRFRR